jgi:pimeloyl-ACP methyl ester carboxylesterase
VLLQGWCLNRKLWIYEAERLLHRRQVLCPDLPGFGDSAGLAGPYQLDRFAAEVAALLD